ncbi:MAG: zinc ribbon domain-containing protein [Chloroflexi bacterium]|nr:zinc ribbon domain-containing protein [Chloroflexota bacterium]
MPMYEYRCPSCRKTFELLRPMARSSEPAACPRGHAGAERIVSLVADRAHGGAGGQFEPSGGGCACSAGGACGCAG